MEVGGESRDEFGKPNTVRRNFVNTASPGNTLLVQSQGPGLRVRVLSGVISSDLGLKVHFRSADVPISPIFAMSGDVPLVLSHNPHGWFQTETNAALNINLSIGSSVGAEIIWVPV